MSFGNFGDRAYRYTAATGLVRLPEPPDTEVSRASGVSSDTGTICGTCGEVFGPTTAVVWEHDGTTVTVLPVPIGWGSSQANGISQDGHVVVGKAIDLFGHNQPVRWLDKGAAVPLGRLNDGQGGEALGADHDGGIIVGLAQDGFDNDHAKAVYWKFAVDLYSATSISPVSPPFDGLSFGAAHGVVVLTPTTWAIAGGQNFALSDPSPQEGFGWIIDVQGMVDFGQVDSSSPANFTIFNGVATNDAWNFVGVGNAIDGAVVMPFICSTTVNVGGVSPVLETAALNTLALLSGADRGGALAISDDGTTAVGYNYGSGISTRAVKWFNVKTATLPEPDPVFLGFLPGGTYSVAAATTTAGGVIVGYADTSDIPPPPFPPATPPVVLMANRFATPLTPEPLSYKDVRVVLDTEWTTTGEWCLLQTYPMPVTVLAVVPEIEVGDTPAP